MWREMAFWSSVNEADLQWGTQAARSGRELETLASVSLESMAGLTQLGIIPPCLAFADVLHVDEACRPLPMPSTSSFTTGLLL